MVVDGGESGFNAEKAEAQEAQRGEGGDFCRVDGGASRFNLAGGTCETRETCGTNDCLNLAGGLGSAGVEFGRRIGPAGVNLNLAGGVVEESAMLNSNLSSYTSHASHTSQGCEAHQILTTPNSSDRLMALPPEDNRACPEKWRNPRAPRASEKGQWDEAVLRMKSRFYKSDLRLCVQAAEDDRYPDEFRAWCFKEIEKIIGRQLTDEDIMFKGSYMRPYGDGEKLDLVPMLVYVGTNVPMNLVAVFNSIVWRNGSVTLIGKKLGCRYRNIRDVENDF